MSVLTIVMVLRCPVPHFQSPPQECLTIGLRGGGGSSSKPICLKSSCTGKNVLWHYWPISKARVVATVSNGFVSLSSREIQILDNGSKSSTSFSLSGAKVRERKFQGAKVLPMELSLPGAKVRRNDTSAMTASIGDKTMRSSLMMHALWYWYRRVVQQHPDGVAHSPMRLDEVR